MKVLKGELTGPSISSGYASLKPPLNALVTGLLTAARTTTSFGDFCESFRAAVLIAAIFFNSPTTIYFNVQQVLCHGTTPELVAENYRYPENI